MDERILIILVYVHQRVWTFNRNVPRYDEHRLILLKFSHPFNCTLRFFFFYISASFQLHILLLNIYIVSKVGDRSQGRLKGSLFNSYYTEVLGRALLLSHDCSTLPLIRTLYCWVLRKEVSSAIFKVFGMTRPGIEPRSPGPLVNILPTRPMIRFNNVMKRRNRKKNTYKWIRKFWYY